MIGVRVGESCEVFGQRLQELVEGGPDDVPDTYVEEYAKYVAKEAACDDGMKLDLKADAEVAEMVANAAKMPFEALRAASRCARLSGRITVIPSCPVVSVSWTPRLPSVGRCPDGPATVV
jgi:hypothetical protein